MQICYSEIVTLSKYGHIALDICHPYVTYILQYTVCRFVSHGKENAKNVNGIIQIL